MLLHLPTYPPPPVFFFFFFFLLFFFFFFVFVLSLCVLFFVLFFVFFLLLNLIVLPLLIFVIYRLFFVRVFFRLVLSSFSFLLVCFQLSYLDFLSYFHLFLFFLHVSPLRLPHHVLIQHDPPPRLLPFPPSSFFLFFHFSLFFFILLVSFFCFFFFFCFPSPYSWCSASSLLTPSLPSISPIITPTISTLFSLTCSHPHSSSVHYHSPRIFYKLIPLPVFCIFCNFYENSLRHGFFCNSHALLGESRGHCTKTKQEWPDSGSKLESIFVIFTE